MFFKQSFATFGVRGTRLALFTPKVPDNRKNGIALAQVSTSLSYAVRTGIADTISDLVRKAASGQCSSCRKALEGDVELIRANATGSFVPISQLDTQSKADLDDVLFTNLQDPLESMEGVKNAPNVGVETFTFHFAIHKVDEILGTVSVQSLQDGIASELSLPQEVVSNMKWGANAELTLAKKRVRGGVDPIYPITEVYPLITRAEFFGLDGQAEMSYTKAPPFCEGGHCQTAAPYIVAAKEFATVLFDGLPDVMKANLTQMTSELEQQIPKTWLENGGWSGWENGALSDAFSKILYLLCGHIIATTVTTTQSARSSTNIVVRLRLRPRVRCTRSLVVPISNSATHYHIIKDFVH